MSNSTMGGLTGKTKVFAVLGCPIEHSRSPAMQNAAIQELGLDCVYVPFRVEPEHLAEAVAGIRAMRFGGVNLTIPLKEVAVSLVDELTDEAARIKAVNTLYWDDDRLIGHSTDGEGFIRSIESIVGRVPSKALILGAGGSSRAICYALADLHVELTIANRTNAKAEKLASELHGVKCHAIGMTEKELERSASSVGLIINCTSLGMTPSVEESPLPEQFITHKHIVYDLVYNPPETLLLKAARKKGAQGLNGLDMLVHQGALSFEIWTGIKPPLDVMKRAAEGKF